MPELSRAHLLLLIGPTVPRPAPAALTSALERIEVTREAGGPTGFQLTFRAGRGQPANPIDYPLLVGRQLAPFNRVIIALRIDMRQFVLVDGVITDQQLDSGEGSGAAALTVTGEDMSVMMDLEEKIIAHPSQSEAVIASKIIAAYARYGVTPLVAPPPTLDVPLPTERVPVQHGTDLAYLREMADRYGYETFVAPGLVPGTSVCYWGPPRPGEPQRALSANMGAESNVRSIRFRYDALAPEQVSGRVIDRRTAQALPVVSVASTRPPLSREPALLRHSVRSSLLRGTGGLTAVEARARAQAATNRSTDRVVVAEGELDTGTYGAALEVGRPVGVRGVGDTFDGLYRVSRVTHIIEQGGGLYLQRFTLTREGVGTLTPVVVP